MAVPSDSPTSLAPTSVNNSRARAGRLAQAGVAVFVVLVAVLHAVRPEMSPLTDPLSNYAVGRFGGLMTAAFVANAVGFTALTVAVRPVVAAPRRQAMTVLLAVAALGMLVAAVARTDVPATTPPTTTGLIHTIAALAAFLCLGAAGVVSLPAFRPAAGPVRGAATALVVGALVALVVFGALTFGGSVGAGLAQRLLTAFLLGWVALTGGWAAGSVRPS